MEDEENDLMGYDYGYDDYCEGCGGNGPCPDCCSHDFAPGTGECDWCVSYDKCVKVEELINKARNEAKGEA